MSVEKKDVQFQRVHPTDEFLGALFMSLQKALLEQKDIRDILEGLQFVVAEGMLFVLNPPVFEVTNKTFVDDVSEEE